MFTDTDNVGVTNLNNVPASFKKATSNGGDFLIAKGQLNKLKVRPCILNEHCESSREVQGTVSSGNIVGQIFKTSHDNINCLSLTLESAGGTVLDDFESYADSAALQGVWVETDPADKAELEAVVVKTGTKAMALPMDATVGDEWVDTIVATNYTGFTFSLSFEQTRDYSLAQMQFFIGDGTYTKSFDLVVQTEDSFYHFDINESEMIDDDATTPTMSAITEMGFRLIGRLPGTIGYVDDLVASPAPGSLNIELWDMGTTIPVTGVASIDSGTQYTELGDRGINGGTVVSAVTLQLLGGKKLYSLTNFVAGVALEIPSNTLLNKDHYYMITLNYVDTDVAVYGPDTSFAYHYYVNGYAFTAPDKATAITAIGPYSDIMFNVFSTQDVYLTQFVQFIDAAPGSNAKTNVFIEDKNMKITDIIAVNTRPIQQISADVEFRPYLIPKGGKFEQYYNDDFTDSVSSINMQIGYTYREEFTNG